jgi:hypothetical protein
MTQDRQPLVEPGLSDHPIDAIPLRPDDATDRFVPGRLIRHGCNVPGAHHRNL